MFSGFSPQTCHSWSWQTKAQPLCDNLKIFFVISAHFWSVFGWLLSAAKKNRIKLSDVRTMGKTKQKYDTKYLWLAIQDQCMVQNNLKPQNYRPYMYPLYFIWTWFMINISLPTTFLYFDGKERWHTSNVRHSQLRKILFSSNVPYNTETNYHPVSFLWGGKRLHMTLLCDFMWQSRIVQMSCYITTCNVSLP